MFFLITLSSSLLISVVGIFILISHRMMHPAGREMNHGTFTDMQPTLFRERLASLFRDIYKRSTHSLLPRIRDVYKVTERNISYRINLFANIVMGKDSPGHGKKGAVSFFLKSIAENKKIRKGKE